MKYYNPKSQSKDDLGTMHTSLVVKKAFQLKHFVIQCTSIWQESEIYWKKLWQFKFFALGSVETFLKLKPTYPSTGLDLTTH
jgi:hypothetical protein